MTVNTLLNAIFRGDIHLTAASVQRTWEQSVNDLGGLDPVVQKLAAAALLLNDVAKMTGMDRCWCVVESDDGERYALNTPSTREGAVFQLQDDEEEESDIYFDVVVKQVLGYWLTSDEADTLLKRGGSPPPTPPNEIPF